MPPKLEDQLAYLIASVNRQLEGELASSQEADGLPIEQIRILSALGSEDGRSMRELAAVVLVDPASLTKIVDRMVSDALVYRAPDPADRRKVLVFLARKGAAMNSRLQGAQTQQEEKLVSRLDARHARELENLLRRLI